MTICNQGIHIKGRKLVKKLILMMVLLVLSGTSMALDDSSYEETFARSYTTTIMHYPSLCQTDEFAKSFSALASFSSTSQLF